MAALENWAILKNYKVILADRDWLINQDNSSIINYSRFDINTATKIKKLYETNKKN